MAVEPVHVKLQRARFRNAENLRIPFLAFPPPSASSSYLTDTTDPAVRRNLSYAITANLSFAFPNVRSKNADAASSSDGVSSLLSSGGFGSDSSGAFECALWRGSSAMAHFIAPGRVGSFDPCTGKGSTAVECFVSKSSSSSVRNRLRARTDSPRRVEVIRDSLSSSLSLSSVVYREVLRM